MRLPRLQRLQQGGAAEPARTRDGVDGQAQHSTGCDVREVGVPE